MTDAAVGRVRARARAMLIVLALLHVWAARFTISPDGLAYLDLADGWGESVDSVLTNAYWSPAYPFVLGVALSTLVPTPAWESMLVRTVDFGFFVAALLTFELFWSTALGTFRRGLVPIEERSDEPSAWALGYALFGASCLALTNVVETTPDLFSAIWIFLAAAITLRLLRSPGLATMRAGIGLGWVLGAGYLTKLALLGPGLVVLGLLATVRRTRKTALGGVLGLAMLIAPWALMLFVEHARPTLGEAGRLNLAWYVLGEGGGQHWRGDGAVHPTRLLHIDPPVNGFAEPIAGTYPPWLDPVYWHEGLALRFDPAAHLRITVHHLGVLAEGWLLPHGLLWIAVLALARHGHRHRDHLGLIVIAIVAAAGYLLVHVELRFFGPWAVLLAAGLLGTHLGGTRPSRSFRRWVTVAVLGAMVPVAWTTATLVSKQRDAVVDPSFTAHADLGIADGLRSVGLRREDRIAVVGYPMDAYWARLAKARIVADVFARSDRPDGTAAVERFWSVDDATRDAVFSAMAAEGAAWVVTRRRDVPPSVDPVKTGWQAIDGTDAFVRRLDADR
ncbi:MAG: hypothetical protein AAGE94_01015 [Acidobacteriota bacterium]